MKRIQCNTVTDTIARMMEEAPGVDQVLILYRFTPTGDLKDGSARATYGHMCNDALTEGDANFLVDSFKAWLFGCFVEREEEDA